MAEMVGSLTLMWEIWIEFLSPRHLDKRSLCLPNKIKLFLKFMENVNYLLITFFHELFEGMCECMQLSVWHGLTTGLGIY